MSEEVDYLDVDALLEIAAGVLPEVAVRDVGLLASAAARPQTSVFGEDAYPAFAQKVAALLHSVARNHPLVGGNERLAWAGARVSCQLNGRDLRYDAVSDPERMVLGAAAGELDVPDIASWAERHLVPVTS